MTNESMEQELKVNGENMNSSSVRNAGKFFKIQCCKLHDSREHAPVSFISK